MSLIDRVLRHPAVRATGEEVAKEAAHATLGVFKHRGRGHDTRHAVAHHVVDRLQAVHDGGIAKGIKEFKAETRKTPFRGLALASFGWLTRRTTGHLLHGAHRVVDVHAGKDPDKHYELPAHAKRIRAARARRG